MPSRITQAYVSKSIADFPFHRIYQLDDYNNTEEPCVFFGAYRYEDIQLINNHKGKTLVFWTGQDALDHSGFFIKECEHVTAHPKVYNKLKTEFENIKLVSPASFLNEAKPQKLWHKIYAYCPSSAAEYHGSEILSRLPYEICIGLGDIPQNQWRERGDEFYKDIFVGLCLSEFAGGGTSIIEMGLRGIAVITNVFTLPNCIPWTDTDDVIRKIEAEKVHIGYYNRKLAQQVWESLDHEYKWLEYEN